MKKYLNITKMVILEKMQYVFNYMSGLVMYGMFIFIFLQLWKYMYSEDSLIAGYSLNQMVWYVAITEILWATIRPKTLKRELSNDIKSGKIAYVLNKPFDFIKYLIAKYIGEAIVSSLIFGTVGTLISLFIIGGLETFKIVSIPFIIITFINASLITVLTYISICLTAFWFEENEPFVWVYEKLILTLGVMFPVEIFPMFIRPFIKFSPVFVTTYAPSKMIVDFSINSFIEIFIFQIVYLLIFSVLCKIMYKKGERKLSVNGG